jgi:hypothetical protein
MAGKEQQREADAEDPRDRLSRDPLMQLRGLGKEVWQRLGGGDAVIEWLRSDEVVPPPWAKGPPQRLS